VAGHEARGTRPNFSTHGDFQAELTPPLVTAFTFFAAFFGESKFWLGALLIAKLGDLFTVAGQSGAEVRKQKVLDQVVAA